MKAAGWVVAGCLVAMSAPGAPRWDKVFGRAGQKTALKDDRIVAGLKDVLRGAPAIR